MTSICGRDIHVPRTMRAIGERNLPVNTSWKSAMIRWHKKHNNKRQTVINFLSSKDIHMQLCVLVCISSCACVGLRSTVQKRPLQSRYIHNGKHDRERERGTTATRQRRTTSTRVQLRLEKKRRRKKGVAHIHSGYNAGLSKRITGGESEYRLVKQAA